jgi:hypothetical protein
MDEQSFKANYRALQQGIIVTEELKQRTLARAWEQVRERAGGRERERAQAWEQGSTQGHACNGDTQEARTREGDAQDGSSAAGIRIHFRARGIGRRLVGVAAACLLMAGIGLGATIINRNVQPQDSPSPLVLPLDFSIQAYASSTGQTMNLAPGGVLYFDSGRIGRTYSPSDAATFKAWGYYTACLFSVKGTGITRVRVETSRGELYSYASRRLTGDEDPDFIEAALSWKPGHDPFMGTYDNVDAPLPENYDMIYETSASEEEAWARLLSAEATWTINLMKRLGPTADMPIDAQGGARAEDHYFGLWVNDGTGSFDTRLDTFAGHTLTITTWRGERQGTSVVIELMPADVKARMIMTESYDGFPLLLGYELSDEVVDRESLNDEQLSQLYDEGYAIVHTLSGTVISMKNG